MCAVLWSLYLPLFLCLSSFLILVLVLVLVLVVFCSLLCSALLFSSLLFSSLLFSSLLFSVLSCLFLGLVFLSLLVTLTSTPSSPLPLCLSLSLSLSLCLLVSVSHPFVAASVHPRGIVCLSCCFYLQYFNKGMVTAVLDQLLSFHRKSLNKMIMLTMSGDHTPEGFTTLLEPHLKNPTLIPTPKPWAQLCPPRRPKVDSALFFHEWVASAHR